MEHEFLFGTFGTQNVIFLEILVVTEVFFNWNDLKSHVPFAFQLDFLETFCIWLTRTVVSTL